jgi:hypothetical protein
LGRESLFATLFLFSGHYAASFLHGRRFLARFWDIGHAAALRVKYLELSEPEVRGEDEEAERNGVVPSQRFAQIPCGKQRKDGQRNHFLHRLQLRGGIDAMAQVVGGDSKAILEKGDAPANGDE